MRDRETTRIQQSRSSLESQRGAAESQLPLLNLDQMTLHEQRLVAGSSSAVGRVKQGELAQKTAASSLPLTKSDVLHASKQPRSFPDRLAMIQKQKQIEEYKTFARSSVRALKVSNELHSWCNFMS